MNFNNLVKALTCNNSADEADNLGCGNKRCKYRDVDGACDIVGMCEDAAIAIKQLAAIMDILGDDYDLDRLRELVEADRDGRCTITQCKFGDTVYVAGSKKIVEARIQEIYLDDVSELIYLVDFTCDNSCDGCPFNSWSQSWEGEWECGGEYGDGAIKQSDFGKTVFLTREFAEAALKAREQDG